MNSTTDVEHLVRDVSQFSSENRHLELRWLSLTHASEPFGPSRTRAVCHERSGMLGLLVV
jgi:hypothetical protein